MVFSNRLKPAEHKAWADLCRVVAIFGVVLIHSLGAAFYQYGKTPLSDWLTVNFLDSLVRCAVPCFVMLSGALILRAGEIVTFPKLWRRIVKVLLPLLVWSGLYLKWVSYNSGVAVDWLSILSTPAMYHLGFVYVIIGIYMLLPVFQVLFETLRIQLGIRIYLFMFWLVVTCVPVYWPLPLLSLLHQSSLFGFGGYFLMGGVIASLPRDRIPTIVWAFIFVASVLATFGITWYLSWKNNAPIETSYIYYSPNVAISAISAFVLFTRATLTVSMAKTMKWLGERVFLLFFVHVVVLEFVRYSNFISTVSQHSPMLITILIISILTFVISLIIASLIRFVPGAQRVFG